MRNIFLIAFVVILGCKKDDKIDSKDCSIISSYQDTLFVDNHKLWLISLTSGRGGGTLEIVDENNNNINGSANFSINRVQLIKGSNCWETNVISGRIGSSSHVYAGTYKDVPTWAYDTNTKAIIQLTISGNLYFLVDHKVNN